MCRVALFRGSAVSKHPYTAVIEYTTPPATTRPSSVYTDIDTFHYITLNSVSK
jgi:hypothetical protein